MLCSMKKHEAIALAGSVTALADLLEITPGAVSLWGENVPDARVWQLKVIRPEWWWKDGTVKQVLPRGNVPETTGGAA